MHKIYTFPSCLETSCAGGRCGSAKLLVCLQTFSYTVMCKVCLTASNTLFDADAFVRLNHWISPNIWRTRFLVFPPHWTHWTYFAILVVQFTRHLLRLTLNPRTKNTRLMSSLYKDIYPLEVQATYPHVYTCSHHLVLSRAYRSVVAKRRPLSSLII